MFDYIDYMIKQIFLIIMTIYLINKKISITTIIRLMENVKLFRLSSIIRLIEDNRDIIINNNRL